MIVFVVAAAGGSHWTMFSKKLHVDVKKSTLKIQDVKKDSATRFKHLKIVLGEPTFHYPNRSFLLLYESANVNSLWKLIMNEELPVNEYDDS